MKALKIALFLSCLPIAALVAVYATLGRTPATALVTHGGAMFLPVARDSDRLSASIRRVLAGDPGDPRPGVFAWRETEPGFEVGELPVLVDGEPVDHLLLAKVDPARFRVIARNDPSALTTVDAWRRALAAKLVVNGSYYATSGLPDTPFVADSRQIGPDPYDARQGALVVSNKAAAIDDLAHADWHRLFEGARDALVSYPLLVADGKPRPVKPSLWLANRTFVAIDDHGWVVFGTTEDAYFSLRHLAEFLPTAPLGLRSVLNLDGGPVACQAIVSGSFQRSFCGAYEIQADGGGVKKLSWAYGGWTLPIVLAVVPR